MTFFKALVLLSGALLYGYSIGFMCAQQDHALGSCSYVYEPLAEYRELQDYDDFGYEYQPAYQTRSGQVYYQFPYYNGGSVDFGPEYNTYNYGRGSEYYEYCE